MDTGQLARDLAGSPAWSQALLVAKGADGRLERWRALRDQAGVRVAPLGSRAAEGLERLARVRTDLHVLGVRVAPAGVQLRVLDAGSGPATSTERPEDARLAPGEFIDFAPLLEPGAKGTIPRLVVHDLGAPVTQPRQARLAPDHPATIDTIDSLRRRLAGATLHEDHWLVREAGLPAGALLAGVIVGGRAQPHQEGVLASVDAARHAAVTQGKPVEVGVEVVTEHGFERRRLQVSPDGRTTEDEKARRVDVALSSASHEAPEVESLLSFGAPYGFRVARAVAWSAEGDRLTDDSGDEEAVGERAIDSSISTDDWDEGPPPGVEPDDFADYLQAYEGAAAYAVNEDVGPQVDAALDRLGQETLALRELMRSVCERVVRAPQAMEEAAAEALVAKLLAELHVARRRFEEREKEYELGEPMKGPDAQEVLQASTALLPLLKVLAQEARAIANRADLPETERQQRVDALIEAADLRTTQGDGVAPSPEKFRARLQEADSRFGLSEDEGAGEGETDEVDEAGGPDEADEADQPVDPARPQERLNAQVLRLETAATFLGQSVAGNDVRLTDGALENAESALNSPRAPAPASERLGSLRAAADALDEAMGIALATPGGERERSVQKVISWFGEFADSLLRGARTADEVRKLLHVHRAIAARASAPLGEQAGSLKPALLTGRRFTTLRELETFLSETVPLGGTVQLFAPDGRVRLECVKSEGVHPGVSSHRWLVSVITGPPADGAVGAR